MLKVIHWKLLVSLSECVESELSGDYCGPWARCSLASALPEYRASSWINWHVAPCSTLVCVPRKQQDCSLGHWRFLQVQDCVPLTVFFPAAVSKALSGISFMTAEWKTGGLPEYLIKTKPSHHVTCLRVSLPPPSPACSLWLMLSCFPEPTVSTMDKKDGFAGSKGFTKLKMCSLYAHGRCDGNAVPPSPYMHTHLLAKKYGEL